MGTDGVSVAAAAEDNSPGSGLGGAAGGGFCGGSAGGLVLLALVARSRAGRGTSQGKH